MGERTAEGGVVTADPFGRDDPVLATACAVCPNPIRVGDLYYGNGGGPRVHYNCYIDHGLAATVINNGEGLHGPY